MKKHLAIRLLLLPISLLFSCFIAGTYGAVHNQISYTVSPEYFHNFKFIQFHMPVEYHDRLGASMVGWRASWWMGVLIGLPIFIMGLLIRDNSLFAKTYLKSSLMVVFMTLAVGLSALVIGFFTIQEGNIPPWVAEAYPNPVSFMRAGNMHNYTYLGGGIGMLAGCIYMISVAISSRKSAQS